VPDWLTTHGRMGMFIDRQWYCSTRCVEDAVRQRISGLPPVEPAYVQGWRAMKLGSLLMQQAGLSRDVIEAAAAEQERRGVPIGRTLCELGLVTSEDVLRALATQAGVRYLTAVNPRVVAHSPGGLPRDVVKALGVVPIAADPRRREMQVACIAPVPGLAVRALTRLTDWAVEPLLVADDALPHLVELYATARSPRAAIVGAVCDPLSGPARVAQFAKRRRRVRMAHERCDPYVWVRLDADGATADVLMSMPEFERGF
jgi:hypothetical protein